MILPMLNESIAASHRTGVTEDAAIMAAIDQLKGYTLLPGEYDSACDHIRRVAARAYHPTVITADAATADAANPIWVTATMNAAGVARARERVRAWLAEHPWLTKGMNGPDRDGVCSIGAINMALFGSRHDQIPACSSVALGRWIVRVQDAMPRDIRCSPAWAAQLPRIIGTAGPRRELAIFAVCTLSVFRALELAIPAVRTEAARTAWTTMCTLQTYEAVEAAEAASSVETVAYPDLRSDLRRSAHAMAHTAVLEMLQDMNAGSPAARAGHVYMGRAIGTAAYAVDRAGRLASDQAYKYVSGESMQSRDFWAAFDPVGWLTRMLDAADAVGVKRKHDDEKDVR